MDFESMILFLPGIIVGLTVHEFAHASVASRLGDDTARLQGRASLNPLVHIDPLGFLFLLIAGFGWAKPVVIDHSKLAHPRRDDAVIAAAGPLSNLMLSIVGAALFTLLVRLIPYQGEAVYGWTLHALMAGIYVNLGLFVFNAIPLPPLDGSHVLLSALNLRDSPAAHAVFRYGMILLFAIILAEQLFHIDILPIGKMVRALADMLLGLFGFSGL